MKVNMNNNNNKNTSANNPSLNKKTQKRLTSTERRYVSLMNDSRIEMDRLLNHMQFLIDILVDKKNNIQISSVMIEKVQKFPLNKKLVQRLRKTVQTKLQKNTKLSAKQSTNTHDLLTELLALHSRVIQKSNQLSFMFNDNLFSSSKLLQTIIAYIHIAQLELFVKFPHKLTHNNNQLQFARSLTIDHTPHTNIHTRRTLSPSKHRQPSTHFSRKINPYSISHSNSNDNSNKNYTLNIAEPECEQIALCNAQQISFCTSMDEIKDDYGQSLPFCSSPVSHSTSLLPSIITICDSQSPQPLLSPGFLSYDFSRITSGRSMDILQNEDILQTQSISLIAEPEVIPFSNSMPFIPLRNNTLHIIPHIVIDVLFKLLKGFLFEKNSRHTQVIRISTDGLMCTLMKSLAYATVVFGDLLIDSKLKCEINSPQVYRLLIQSNISVNNYQSFGVGFVTDKFNACGGMNSKDCESIKHGLLLFGDGCYFEAPDFHDDEDDEIYNIVKKYPSWLKTSVVDGKCQTLIEISVDMNERIARVRSVFSVEEFQSEENVCVRDRNGEYFTFELPEKVRIVFHMEWQQQSIKVIDERYIGQTL